MLLNAVYTRQSQMTPVSEFKKKLSVVTYIMTSSINIQRANTLPSASFGVSLLAPPTLRAFDHVFIMTSTNGASLAGDDSG